MRLLLTSFYLWLIGLVFLETEIEERSGFEGENLVHLLKEGGESVATILEAI